MSASFVPPNPVEPVRPLDLAQAKTLGGILTAAWRIWRARPAIFLLTAIVVASVPLAAFDIVSNLVLRDLTDRFESVDESTSLTSDQVDALVRFGITLFVGSIVTAILVPAVVTATHARAVLALASGDDLTAGDALRRGLAAFGVVVATILLWGVLVFAGLLCFFLLFIPGIWILVAGAFATLIAAVTDKGPWSAIKESVRVVRAVGWWRTWGTLIVVTLVAYAVVLIPQTILGQIASAADAIPVYVATGIVNGVLQAAVMSWTALATTLVFFSWKARMDERWLSPAGTLPVEIPGDGGTPPPGGWPTASAPSANPGTANPSGPQFVRPGQAPPSAAPGSPSGLPGAGQPPSAHGDDERPHYEPPPR